MDTKKALKFLEKFKTAEEAVKLKGLERAEYLKALDTAYGDQATRAKNMGFGSKQNFYHGTSADNIEKFDPKLADKSNTLGPGRDLGSFFTSNPEIASEYAGEAGNVIPVKIKRKGTSALELEGGEFGFDEAANAKMMLEGKPNVTIKGDKGVPSNYEKNLSGDTVIVKDPSSVRSTNAAFDPRFKDSDLIMAAKGTNKSVLSKLGDTISAPQRYTMDKIANMLGVKGDASNSEASAQAIVERAAQLSGLPDSAPLNAAKALGVAGLEVFADPTNLVPVGKIAKGIGMAANAVPGVKAVADKVPEFVVNRLKILYNQNQAKWDNAAKKNPGLQATLDKIKGVKPKENFGKVTVKEAPKQELGEVIMKQPEVQKQFGKTIIKQQPDGQILILDENGKVLKALKGATTIGSK